VAFYLAQVASARSDFIQSVIAEGRSDIVKELEYSRQKVNECSTKRTSYGDEAKFLNCERAENNIDPLVRNFDQKTIINGTATPYYCYGKKLNPSFMDNWFCCEKIEK